MIRTVDSDVVIIALDAFNRLGHDIEQLWIDFGVGKSRRYLPVHTMATNIHANVSESILYFHAFTGCDTVSTFSGVGKKGAWNAWMKFREIDEVFCKLTNTCYDLQEADFKVFAAFCCLDIR